MSSTFDKMAAARAARDALEARLAGVRIVDEHGQPLAESIHEQIASWLEEHCDDQEYCLDGFFTAGQHDITKIAAAIRAGRWKP